MNRDSAAYGRLLQALAPPGLAWSRDPASTFGKLALGLGDEFARLDVRGKNLVEEADPRATVELLADWETEYGLPDPCAGDVAIQTLEGRRQRLAAKIAENGGLSRAELIALAENLGYAITITTFAPCTCDSACDSPLYVTDDRFVWQVNAPEVTVTPSTCDSFCDVPLQTFGNDVLECNLRRYNPPHCIVRFAYS